MHALGLQRIELAWRCVEVVEQRVGHGLDRHVLAGRVGGRHAAARHQAIDHVAELVGLRRRVRVVDPARERGEYLGDAAHVDAAQPARTHVHHQEANVEVAAAAQRRHHRAGDELAQQAGHQVREHEVRERLGRHRQRDVGGVEEARDADLVVGAGLLGQAVVESKVLEARNVGAARHDVHHLLRVVQ